MASNNSFNLPLDDNQVILGKTGLVPEVATLTAGTNMSIVASPGALTFNSTGAPDIPLIDNQVVLGKTALPPEATTLVAGTNMTLTPGVGTLTFNAASSRQWTNVDITSAPPGAGNQLVMTPNTLYNVGNNTSAFNAQFVVPNGGTIGDQYIITTHGPVGAVTALAPLAPYGAIFLYQNTNTRTATFAPSATYQSGFLWLMYIGSIFISTLPAGTYAGFQVLLKDNVTLT